MPTRKAMPSAPKADEVPVTRAMLDGVRTEVLQRIDLARAEAKADTAELKAELIAEIHGMRGQMEGRIDGMQGRIDGMQGRIDGMQGQMHTMQGQMHTMQGQIHRIEAQMHGIGAQMTRVEVLVEEQNARNKIVLDGIAALLSRQNQVEQRVTQVEETVRRLATAHPVG
jgi:chromosome segregation ATPase